MKRPRKLTDIARLEKRSKWIALLGRRDEPTDALRDYCSCLGEGLERRGVKLTLESVSWYREGSLRAFTNLWFRSASWRNAWVLVQYTALGWSRRGFSFRVLLSLCMLRFRGIPCALVFHDLRGYEGRRIVDHVRRFIQTWVMLQAYRLADRSIFTIPVENIDWLPGHPKKASFISIGANLPKSELQSIKGGDARVAKSKTIAIFGVTGGDALASEVLEIADTILHVVKDHPSLNLLMLGRNSQEAELPLKRALKGAAVNIEVLGIISSTEIVRRLSSSDVLLFVRGPVVGSRSSALAGVACGLPIIGYRGKDTGFPITEAGLELVDKGSGDTLGLALNRVLSDDRLRGDLSRKSHRAYTDHYSWERIAQAFVFELDHA